MSNGLPNMIRVSLSVVLKVIEDGRVAILFPGDSAKTILISGCYETLSQLCFGGLCYCKLRVCPR